ncbi:hypothetical protein [Nocardia sputorum]|uniref:DUF2236 domain-containing protein n=1 Tax=Nocardia sputorum TaxID=2984338 RepID=A0ABM8CWU0_9NOCA|nr:hypothetical protein [Nocardia sputorum]BDT99458.1 hypothetical protein IFM12276_24870 [Nocardia sputorum]
MGYKIGSARASAADRDPESHRTLSGALYVAVAAVLTLVFLVPQIRLYRDEQPRTDVIAQMRFLRSELRSGLGEEMQGMFPEGFFFSHVLYGLAWTDLARGDTTYRDEALREARWALERLESGSGRGAFDARLRPAYGVFYVGWSSRLRGAVIELAGAAAPEAAQFIADCEALAVAFGTDGPFLAAYPGQAWPVDNVVAVSALRLHDRIFGSRFEPVIAEWLTSARAHLDPATGLLPHRAAPMMEGARGSSQSMIQRFLPEIDPAWAAQQYRTFRRLFIDTPLGLPGVREYPHGRSGAGDVDSGPLILGVSASATVVTIGAARVHGDRNLAGPITGLGESLGMPVTLGNSKRYAFGALPIGDAFLAWSFAAPLASTATSFPPVVSWWWRPLWHALALTVLTPLWFPIARGLVRRVRRGRSSTSTVGRLPG